MRTFIAIDIPEQVKENLAALQKEISNNYAKIKWVSAENMHLTLKFLGDVSDEKIEDVKTRLSKISFKQFDIELSGIGVFPSEHYIRVIWVGFKDDKHIKMLTSKIDEQLPEFKEDHEFKAHLTIGRVNFVKDKKALVECLKNLKLKPERFAVKEFKLYKSTLTGKGPIYDVISVFSAR